MLSFFLLGYECTTIKACARTTRAIGMRPTWSWRPSGTWSGSSIGWSAEPLGCFCKRNWLIGSIPTGRGQWSKSKPTIMKTALILDQVRRFTVCAVHFEFKLFLMFSNGGTQRFHAGRRHFHHRARRGRHDGQRLRQQDATSSLRSADGPVRVATREASQGRQGRLR